MKEPVLSIFVTWAIVNALKPTITWIRKGEISKKTIFANGGMPSGHTALVASLATTLYLETGFSPLFLTGVVMAMIVIYDAIRVRTIIEKQSRILNVLLKEKNGKKELEETVGHTPAEVLVSLALSVIIPVVVYKIL